MLFEFWIVFSQHYVILSYRADSIIRDSEKSVNKRKLRQSLLAVKKDIPRRNGGYLCYMVRIVFDLFVIYDLAKISLQRRTAYQAAVDIRLSE